jgi:hypothetical protein
MLKSKDLQSGDLRGVTYEFTAAGDVLPMHKHGANDTHVTFFRHGSFRVHGPKIGAMILKAGAFVDWPSDIEHEYVALEPGSVLTNITKVMHAS